MNIFLILKPLIKYPVTLLILLLVGYTQVFAHLYLGNAIGSGKKIRQSPEIQALAIKTAQVERIYFEEEEIEEDDRITAKKHFAEIPVFSYIAVLQYFRQQNITYTYVSNYFSRHATFQSPYLMLRVFRL